MTEIQIPKDATVHKCLPQDVLVHERQRKVARNRKDFEEFKTTIADYGQLQPGICTRDPDGKPTLLIGEGRLQACRELGIEFRFIFKDDIRSKADLYAIELIENVYREDLHFTDRCEAMLKLHELRQEEKGATRPGAAGGHGVRDTAKEVKLSVGTTQEDIKIAMYAREIPEIANAPNRTTARKLIQRFEEEIGREEALDEAIKESEKAQEQLGETTTTGEANESSGTSSEEKRLLEYNNRCLLGSMEDSLKDLPYQDFDVVCFDPPWGVNFDSVSFETGTTKHFQDDAEIVRELLPGWLRLVYASMAENSHLYLFFGIIHHELVYSTLEDLRTREEKEAEKSPYGFVTNRMPIFWYKKGAHRTRAPEVWPGRCYEAIAYARKGSKKLAKYGEPDIVPTPIPTPKMKQNHPSAKHPDIYRNLLIRSCAPGDKVLDPMAGSGMMAVAAESLRNVLRLDWYQIEKDEDFLVTQLWNLQLGYHGVLGDKGQTVAPSASGKVTAERSTPALPEDFRELTPGTDQWRQYWAANEDKQEEMLEYKKSLG